MSIEATTIDDLAGQDVIEMSEVRDALRSVRDALDRLEDEANVLEEITENVGRYATLVSESGLRDYVQEKVRDEVELPSWLVSHIDWDAAAGEYAEDLSSYELDGYDYYVVAD